MDSLFDGKLSALTASGNERLFDFNRGIEKEALRVDLQGRLAATPHPPFLGSKLCNSLITTDFSEAQLELITPVFTSVEEVMGQLRDIHRFVYAGLQDELLWTASMPCVLQGDQNIPLAQYGSSNLGNLKTTYRNGLGHRYGRSMQTICAVHYNFSFGDAFWKKLAEIENEDDSPAYRSERYFDLMRNFRRFSWLLIYLFGASPAVCNTFVEGRPHSLERFDEGSLYVDGATSLRNGDLGYQSNTQSGLINICYNSLGDYVKSLVDAICTPYEEYRKLGLKKNGEYIQVSPNILQSEAEFYTTIRAKRIPPEGANFLECLLEEGVEYIEIRLLDVNPYLALGIDEEEVNFLDAFLVYCLLEESPSHDDPLCQSVRENVMTTVYRGRVPDTVLMDGNRERSIKDWGSAILSGVQAVADALGNGNNNPGSRSVSAQMDKLENPDLTPSARILEDMRRESIPFFRFAMNKAMEHRQHFLSQPLADADRNVFEELAAQSTVDQQEIERSDTISFDEYLTHFLDGYQSLLERL